MKKILKTVAPNRRAPRKRATRRDPGKKDPNTDKIRRLAKALQEQVKGILYSLDKYESDPHKYTPQLDNVDYHAIQAGSYSRTILRLLGRA